MSAIIMGVTPLLSRQCRPTASAELILSSPHSSSWPRFEASFTPMNKPRNGQTLITATIASLAIACLFSAGEGASAQDWITAPSYYTHNPQSGERVNQYYRVDEVVHTPSTYRSVYRHTRSSLQVGDSIDQYHAVDNYGDVVRPYGEWRFPYRPFSVPYSQWGPQPVWGGYGGPGPIWGHPGWGGGGGYGSPYGPSGVINGAGFPPPWNDGSYPDVRRTQLPPQPFPAPTTNFQNNVNGNNNNINN